MSFPKNGIPLTVQNFDLVGEQLRPLLEDGKCYRMVIKPWQDRRSLNQNALSHMWYAEISAWLVHHGRTSCSPEWVKDAMKHTYLGYETIERVDVITGEVAKVQQLRHTSDLKTGEMHDFLLKVEAWALMLGCLLTTPHDCEFMQLRDQQTE
ncbi:recombination protein NinB [Escherichia coli]|nr:recombination protein NinB [Escherichia coli]